LPGALDTRAISTQAQTITTSPLDKPQTRGKTTSKKPKQNTRKANGVDECLYLGELYQGILNKQKKEYKALLKSSAS